MYDTSQIMVGDPTEKQRIAFEASITQDTPDTRAPGSWQSPGFAELPSEITTRYEILRQLGRGASGIVYQAHDRETGECVAVKLLRPELAADPAAMARFKNELRLARQITHPNVCRIYEFQRAGNTAFISMESVEGESLRSLLGRRRKLAWQEALPLARLSQTPGLGSHPGGGAAEFEAL
jgi:serine/threonine-protein kinase